MKIESARLPSLTRSHSTLTHVEISNFGVDPALFYNDVNVLARLFFFGLNIWETLEQGELHLRMQHTYT